MTTASPFETMCAQARQALRSRDYRLAVELFTRAGQLDDLQYEVHEGLGTAHFLAGDAEAAATAFQRVIALKPRHAPAYINLGAVYNRMGQFTKSLEILRKGIQIDRKSAEGYYNLGIAHRRLNQMSLAVPAYREAIRLNPAMVEAHQNLGNVYLEMGNHQQAIMHFKKALEIDPKFSRAARSLAAAESAVSEVRRTTNPFGRLVDAAPPRENAVEVASDRAGRRPLTRDERFQDRQAVQRLVQEIIVATQELAGHAQRDLVSRVRELDRALTRESQVPGSLEDAHTGLRPVTQQHLQLRHKLGEIVQSLREHDQRMQRLMAEAVTT